MSKKLRVALAGFGVVGERRYNVLKEHVDYKVVAIADKNLSSRNVMDPEVNLFKNFSDLSMASNLNIDALFVSLPNDVAPNATKMGLENGWHVFCEKPPGRTVGDIREVLQIANKNPKLKLKYGFNHRYHDSIQTALSIIRSKEMGKIINMRGVYGKSEFIPWPRPSHEVLRKSGAEYWRTKKEIAGGGILLDQGIHMLDLMRIFAGNFVDIKSFVSNSFWHHDVEDNAYALMRTTDGVVAMLHSTATQWRHNFTLDIHLEKGALILSGILSGSKSYGDEKLTVIYREENVQGRPRETTTKYIKDNSWSSEIDDFIEDIRKDRAVSAGSGYDALKIMELVFNIYNADETWVDKNDLPVYKNPLISNGGINE